MSENFKFNSSNEFFESFCDRLVSLNLLKDINSEVTENNFLVSLEGVKGGLSAVVISWLRKVIKGPILVITPSEQEADLLTDDIRSYLSSSTTKQVENEDREVIINLVRRFHSWNSIPYAKSSPSATTFGERASLLTDLASYSHKDYVIVSSLRAALSVVPPASYLRSKVLHLKLGHKVNFENLKAQLSVFGYLRVPRVSLQGEFSVKGEIIEIYPFQAKYAVRIILDFDQIEELKKFEVISQRSISKLEEITISPVREVQIDDELLETLRKNLKNFRLSDQSQMETIEKIVEYSQEICVELFFPLFFDNQQSITSLLSEYGTMVLTSEERMHASFEAIRKEYGQLYLEAISDGSFQVPPKSIFIDYYSLVSNFPRRIAFNELSHTSTFDEAIKKSEFKLTKLRIESDAPRSFFGNIPYFREEIKRFIDAKYQVVIFAVYEHQADRLRALLGEIMNDSYLITIIPESISAGFAVPKAKTIVIQENEIFGRKRRIPRKAISAETETIDSFVDLTEGDYVVHISYGFSRYHGIDRIKVTGYERDYIRLEFAREEFIYLPIEQANLIQRYIGKEGRTPKLDSIGGRSWEDRKNKAKRSVEDLADRLVKLYATRRKLQGTAFEADSDWQAEFEAGFPFQETIDQIRCIEEVKADMEAPVPMDRLVCGDVGYGKTEVALRAAFKAVMSGKQVAVLSPTTILAEQHFKNFIERFKGFPVSVDLLSRFRTKEDQKKVIKGVISGSIDLLVGTHRLIQKDVKFKNLGLLIIDEEQRFGVKHKELLKELKANIDCLTLTATPIPRTLHMSLTKIRDMSLITTPPQNRIPIETFVQEFDEEVVVKAIRKEISRGGQVFYLHNRVRTIEDIYKLLVSLIPEASIAFAHGQMAESELEDVMKRFVSAEFEILIATSIIENGLDIPNVNTILIDRADAFGISQLYQLRGRVGRSDRVAYAYLFYPQGRVLSEIAMKRLKIISDYTELGSGFKVALKDLEIRGAGNLFGGQQSGDILSVGYDMYVRLLQEAILKLSADDNDKADSFTIPEVFLELEYTGYIPDEYISEAIDKMEVYKKIAAVTEIKELEQLHGDLNDRFGPIPELVMSLLSISEIKLLCNQLAISSLREKDGVVTIEFAQIQHISMEKVMRALTESQGAIRIDSNKPNYLFIETGHIGLKEKSEFLSERLRGLI